MALARLNLGQYDRARQAYERVIRTTSEAVIVWAAYANLLEISRLSGDRSEFDRLDKFLGTLALPAFGAVITKEILGEGYCRFGDYGRAKANLEAAGAQAREHGFRHIAERIEEKLRGVEAIALLSVAD